MLVLYVQFEHTWQVELLVMYHSCLQILLISPTHPATPQKINIYIYTQSGTKNGNFSKNPTKIEEMYVESTLLTVPQIHDY
jgi:hypothetical protein